MKEQNSIEVSLIPASLVAMARPEVDRMMQGVVFSAPALYSMDDMFKDLEAGKRQLWMFHEHSENFLFAMSRIVEYPQGSVCIIGPIAGRRIRAALSFRDRFELWARWQGATLIHAEVGEKLYKILKHIGYEATGYAVYKPLMTVQ